MRKNSVRRTAAFLAAFSCIGHLAFAETLVQDDDTNVVDEPIEMIVVTGSRIPRTEFESLQPATVLDNETMKLRGSISLAAMLNEQAGFATPTSSPIGPQNSSSVGQNFVDFLGQHRGECGCQAQPQSGQYMVIFHIGSPHIICGIENRLGKRNWSK